MMKCVIQESRAGSRDILSRLLLGSGKVEISGEYESGLDLVDELDLRTPDVAFLDADAHDFESSLLALREAPGPAPLIVLVSDFPEKALLGFDVEATDFLLRPLDEVRMEESLRRLALASRMRATSMRLSNLNETVDELRAERAANVERHHYRDFWLRSRNANVRVAQSEIVRLEAARGYVYFHLSRTQMLHRISMNELEDRLDPALFLRVHRSSIINVQHLVRTLSNRHGTYAIELANGDQVRVGRKYRSKLNAYMDQCATLGNKSGSIAA